MWYMHTVDYYSALRKKETLHYVTTWITLEDIMLREISQSQKNKYCLISTNTRKLKSQAHRSQEQNGGCRLREGHGGGVVAGRVDFWMRRAAEPRGSAARRSACVHHTACVARDKPWRGRIPCYVFSPQ